VKIYYTTSLLPVVRRLFRLTFITFFLNLFTFFPPSISLPLDFIPIRTPSTGYQPQFQVSENKIFYVWHEDHGPTEPIWVAVETLK
jgi:hypothetical protein